MRQSSPDGSAPARGRGRAPGAGTWVSTAAVAGRDLAPVAVGPSAHARASSARLTSRISWSRACSAGSSTGDQRLDPAVEVAGHQVGRADVGTGHARRRRRWRSRRCGSARGSGRRSSAPGCVSDSPGTPGPQAADAADDEVDLDAGLRRRVERVDHRRRRRGCSSSRRCGRSAPCGGLAADQLGDAGGAASCGRDEQLAVLAPGGRSR